MLILTLMPTLAVLLCLSCLCCFVVEAAPVANARKARILVCGGGAAGYFAAIECARSLAESNQDYSIEILEAGREPLSKVLISGGGRCNVMHDPTKELGVVVKNYPRGERQLKGPLTSSFSPMDTFNWFSTKGVKLKTENDGRVFPTTDKSETIVNVLRSEADRHSVGIKIGAKVTGLAFSQVGDDRSEAFEVSFSKGGESHKQVCDRVIMATGSNPVGHRMMAELGHKIESPLPSLFSFKIADPALRELSGVSTQLARVQLVLSKAFIKSAEGKALGLQRPHAVDSLTQQGPLLITHQGLSGPAILRVSAFGARVLAAFKYDFHIDINWLPHLTTELALQLLLEEKRLGAAKTLGRDVDQDRIGVSLVFRGLLLCSVGIFCLWSGALDIFDILL